MNLTNEIWLLLSLVLMINSCGFDWNPPFHERVAAGQLETVAIAGIDQALTFARIKDNAQKHVIAVRRYQAGRVYGLDLSTELNRLVEDPITMYLEYGYETLRNIIAHASPKSFDISKCNRPWHARRTLCTPHCRRIEFFGTRLRKQREKKSFYFPNSDTLMWTMSHQAWVSPPARAFPDFCLWAICSLSPEIGMTSPKN